jgi:hypothetical protein
VRLLLSPPGGLGRGNDDGKPLERLIRPLRCPSVGKKCSQFDGEFKGAAPSGGSAVLIGAGAGPARAAVANQALPTQWQEG